MTLGEFTVYQFFRDESCERIVEWVDPETAINCAKQLTEGVGARIGWTKRIIITDGGDRTQFEWRFGEGVIYPILVRGAA